MFGHEGFGIGSAQDVANLNKALEAGYGTSPETQVGGGALRVESLENSLKVLTHTDQHVKLWKKIPKLRAYSTVEEYNQLISYGSDGGGFVPEGVLPDTDDSVYQRQAAFVKFIGTTRSVSHQMTLVNSAHGDVIARYTQDGILWLLKKLEHALFWGNSKLAAGGKEYVEFDGLYNQIDPENTIDLRGQHFEEKHMNMGAQMVIENYGIPTDIFLPYEVSAQFSQEFFPKERVIMPTQQGYSAGVVVNDFQTHGGPVSFNPDIFLRKTKPLSMEASSLQAPAAPDNVVAAEAVDAGDFGKSGGAGEYTYYVTCNNRHGESAPFGPVTFAVTDPTKGVQLTITSAQTTQHPIDFFKIYRTEKDGTQAYHIGTVAASSAAPGAVTTFIDTDYVMPNTFTAFMGEMNENVLAFKQLSPMTKMDLAVLAPAYRWMILMYGVPILYAPKKWVRFINIKSDYSV